MLFDRFCLISERLLPQYYDIAKNAKLYKLEEAPHNILPKVITFSPSQQFEPLSPVVAIEDPANLVILIDIQKKSDVSSGVIQFIVVEELRSDDSGYSHYQTIQAGRMEEYKELDKQVVQFDGTISIADGIIYDLNLLKDGNLKAEYKLNKYYMITPNKKNIDEMPIEEMEYFVSNLIAGNATTALEEMLATYRDDFFIVKKEPKLTEKQIARLKKGKKLPRSSEKTIHIIKKQS